MPLGFILLVTIGCYIPGLHGGFLFDDAINIQNNVYIAITQLNVQSLWQAAMSSSAGMLNRPVSMMTFALNHYFSGLDPYYFKITNLVIHLLNGICIFILSSQLLNFHHKLHCPQVPVNSIVWVSMAIAALWLLHPFNLTGVLYVVQRMMSLSTLFTLCGLMLYLNGRKRMFEKQPYCLHIILAAFLIFTPLAVLSKENGALLPVFMLAIEVTILQWQTPDARSRHALITLFSLLVLLPALLLTVFILFNPASITGGYWIRDFSLMERLMTEVRVLWFYVHMTLLPDIAAMGLYHDDIVVSRSLFAPLTTMTSILGLLVLLTGAVLLRRRYPLFSFGVFFFLIGHSMESSVISLELVHEHRNYLPMYGILMPVAYYTLSSVCHPSSLRLRRIAMIVAIVLFAVLTLLRAGQWSEPLGMIKMEALHHPESARANADLAFQYAKLPITSHQQDQDNYRNAIQYFTQAANVSERDTAGFFGVLAVNSARGFSTDLSWTDELEKRLEYFPSLPSSANSLMALEKCNSSGRCILSPQLMERLLRAALRNPTLSGPRRSTVLFSLSNFLLIIKHQPEQAAEAAYLAAAASPEDGGQRLILITLLINMNKLKEAEAEIMKTRSMDMRGKYFLALAELEKQLTDIKVRKSQEKYER